MAKAVVLRAVCSTTVALGFPVVPEVKIAYAALLGEGRIQGIAKGESGIWEIEVWQTAKDFSHSLETLA
jgi:hypothetical protein